MEAGACRADGVFLVHVVRQSDVDGIDLAAGEELVHAVIAAQALHAVAATELLQLLLFSRDQRGQHAVASGVLERRQDRSLSDVTEAEDGVAH